MKKLLFLLLPLSVSAQTITQQQIDSLKAVNNLKYMFTVSFERMLYENELRMGYEKTDSIQKSIIAEYHLQTGISGASAKDLKEAFSLKGSVDTDCFNQLKVEKRKRKAWKTVTIVGIPVSLGLGAFGFYYLQQKFE